MKHRLLSLIVLLVLALVGPATASAEALVLKDTFTAPFNFTAFYECAEEDIAITGQLRITTMTVIDASGGIHGTFTLVPIQVRGVGVTSGITYKAVGGQRDTFTSAANGAFTSNFTSMFNLISQGSTDNLQIFTTAHFTVNARGEVTVDRFDSRGECRG
jgi:hypothetical protein